MGLSLIYYSAGIVHIMVGSVLITKKNDPQTLSLSHLNTWYFVSISLSLPDNLFGKTFYNTLIDSRWGELPMEPGSIF